MSKSQDNRKRAKRAHAKLVANGYVGGNSEGKRQRWQNRSSGKRSWPRQLRRKGKLRPGVNELLIHAVEPSIVFFDMPASGPIRRRGARKVTRSG